MYNEQYLANALQSHQFISSYHKRKEKIRLTIDAHTASTPTPLTLKSASIGHPFPLVTMNHVPSGNSNGNESASQIAPTCRAYAP